MSDEMSFTTAELAALLGCTPRHLQQLAKDGITPKAARGRWPAAAVTAYCRHLQSDARRGPADFAAERARLTRARADVAEIELAHRRGDLLARQDVDAAVAGAFGRVRARLLVLPSKIGAEVAAVGEPAQAAEIIRGAVHDALAELAGTTIDDLVG